MTKKRFILIDMNNIEWELISPIKDNGEDLTVKQVVDLLNSLNDENEQLEKEAEIYNEDAMSYQTLYEQQVKKNKKLNQLIKKIEDNLNKYKLINCLEYEDWKKEIWRGE